MRRQLYTCTWSRFDKCHFTGTEGGFILLIICNQWSFTTSKREALLCFCLMYFQDHISEVAHAYAVFKFIQMCSWVWGRDRDLCVSCIKHVIGFGLTSIQLTIRTKFFFFVILSHGRHLSSSLRWWWRMIRGWWEMRMMEVRDNCIFFYYIADKFDDGGTRWRISFLFQIFYFYILWLKHDVYLLFIQFDFVGGGRGEGTQIWCISFECLIV